MKLGAVLDICFCGEGLPLPTVKVTEVLPNNCNYNRSIFLLFLSCTTVNPEGVTHVT